MMTVLFYTLYAGGCVVFGYALRNKNRNAYIYVLWLIIALQLVSLVYGHMHGK